MKLLTKSPLVMKLVLGIAVTSTAFAEPLLIPVTPGSHATVTLRVENTRGTEVTVTGIKIHFLNTYTDKNTCGLPDTPIDKTISAANAITVPAGQTKDYTVSPTTIYTWANHMNLTGNQCFYIEATAGSIGPTSTSDQFNEMDCSTGSPCVFNTANTSTWTYN